jgi:hypothetical protein
MLGMNISSCSIPLTVKNFCCTYLDHNFHEYMICFDIFGPLSGKEMSEKKCYLSEC